MTAEQLEQLRILITAGRQPVERCDQYAYPRGWNGGLDYVERCIREILGEPQQTAARNILATGEASAVHDDR